MNVHVTLQTAIAWNSVKLSIIKILKYDFNQKQNLNLNNEGFSNFKLLFFRYFATHI